ncbi:MAG: 16S rRNA (cytidine(1402)-2'-O)-methyltransferase [Firmicutes bacterium]|nr:16S rRNA (cytidine(1402)-2'-O)-methyltransferase [Bacillota bacterium]
MTNTGILYLVATPIGNLEDITYRAVRTLQEVDMVAAEDTRHALKLFSRYQVRKRIISYREENRKRQGDYILSQLLEGKNVALISDAGMPGISDPGEDLVRRAVENGIRAVPVPGPTALISALVVSGFSTSAFIFHGFIPKEQAKRRKFLQSLIQEKKTIVLYESPHRIKAVIQEIMDTLGDRRVCICRELTKKFEEILRGTASEILKAVDSSPARGEYVIVIEGLSAGAKENEREKANSSVIEEMFQLMDGGMKRSDAASSVAKSRGISRKEIYTKSLNTNKFKKREPK